MGCLSSKTAEPGSAVREKLVPRNGTFLRGFKTTYRRYVSDNQPNVLRNSRSSISPSHDRYRFSVEISEEEVTQRLSSGEIEVWMICDILGKGGYGEVVLQTREGSGSDGVSLRAVKSILCPPRKDRKYKYIIRELDALIALKEHRDRFVDFYGWYQDNSRTKIYIAMEYHPEGDLRRYIKNNPTGAREQSVDIITQILEGLRIMHSLGICHRDLKPQNVLVASLLPLKLKLADFGISKSLNSSSDISPMATQGIGSSCYMAPEMYPANRPSRRAVEYTEAVDIWALGVITHEVYTGYPTFCIRIPGQGSQSSPPSGIDEPHPSNVSEPSNIFALDTRAFWEYERNATRLPTEHLVSVGAPESLIGFISYLMAVDPKQRPSATHARSHYWLSGDAEPTATPIPNHPQPPGPRFLKGVGGHMSYPRSLDSLLRLKGSSGWALDRPAVGGRHAFDRGEVLRIQVPPVQL